MEGLAVEVGIRAVLCTSSVPALRTHSPPVDTDRQREREYSEKADAAANCACEGRDVVRFLLTGGPGGHDGGKRVGGDDDVVVGRRESWKGPGKRVQVVST